MGKQGPCRHCGATSTPLWRNGPPGKPVLCNACGSRWRTRGTLANYIPSCIRTFECVDSNNFQECKMPMNQDKTKMCKEVCEEGYMERRETFVGHNPCPTGFEDDAGNGSSSEPAKSDSESYVQLGTMVGRGFAGSVQSNFWDYPIPTKKRSSKGRSPSTVEKLRRKLLDIMQQQESSNLAGDSEELLIFEKKDPWSSEEIGLGVVLLEPSLPFTRKESEASSLPKEGKFSCLSNGCVESLCLSPPPQSNEGSMGQESGRLIQETGDTEEFKMNLSKKRAITNKYSGTVLCNPGTPENTHSPRMCINWKPENYKSFTTMNGRTEATSLSHFNEGGTSLHAERNPNLPTSGGLYPPTSRGPYLPTFGTPYLPSSGGPYLRNSGDLYFSTSRGPSFGTIGGSKRLKVGHTTPSSVSVPVFSIGRNFNIHPPLPRFQVGTPVLSRNNFPVFRPSAAALQKEATSVDTRSAAETFHRHTKET